MERHINSVLPCFICGESKLIKGRIGNKADNRWACDACLSKWRYWNVPGRREAVRLSQKRYLNRNRAEINRKNAERLRKHPEWTAKIIAKRRERYHTDPEYRAKILAKEKEYRMRKKANASSSPDLV